MIRIFGDVHAHPYSYGASFASGVSSRLTSIIDVLAETVAVAPGDLLLCTGDLFHQRGLLPTQAANRVMELLQRHALGLVAVAGNHDLVGRSGESALRLLEGIEAPTFVYAGGCAVIALPYAETPEIPRVLSAQAMQAFDPIIVLGHNGFWPDGQSPIPGEKCYHEAMFREAFGDRAKDVIGVFGHWHEPSEFLPDGSRLELLDVEDGLRAAEVTGGFRANVGALVQHHWGDRDGWRGWLDLHRVGESWLVARRQSRGIRLTEDPSRARPGDLLRVVGSAPAQLPPGVVLVEVLPEHAPDAPARSALTLQDTPQVCLRRYLDALSELDEEGRARVLALGSEILGGAR